MKRETYETAAGIEHDLHDWRQLLYKHENKLTDLTADPFKGCCASPSPETKSMADKIERDSTLLAIKRIKKVISDKEAQFARL